MSAPIGNQFWKLRSKHGRDRLFASPVDFWDACCEYFEWVDANPFEKAEAKTVNIGDYQSKVEIVNLPVMRPYTFQGLCRYLDCNTQFFNQFEAATSIKEDDLSKDFSLTIMRVREIIYEQKFSGAAAGFFKESIICRDIGLREETNINLNDQRKATGDLFPFEEAKEIS